MPASNDYVPPSQSHDLVRNVPFGQAARTGEKYTDRFSLWDAREMQKPENRRDQNKCKTSDERDAKSDKKIQKKK